MTSIIDNSWFIKEPHKSTKNTGYIYRLQKDLLVHGLVFIKDFKTRKTYAIKAKKFLEFCSPYGPVSWDLDTKHNDIIDIEKTDIGILLNEDE